MVFKVFCCIVTFMNKLIGPTPEVRGIDCTQLPLHTVTAFAGAVSNEVKLSILYLAGKPETGEFVDRFKIKKTFTDYGVAVSASGEIETAHIGLIQARLAKKKMLCGDPDRGYQRTVIGEIGLGFGGIVAEGAFKSNVPMKTLIGEDGQVLRSDGTIRDGVATRLALWYVLHRTKPKRWETFMDVTGELEKLGFPENGIRHCLDKLVVAKAVEKRQDPTTKKPSMQIRIREIEGTEYRKAIAGYLKAIGTLATMDTPTLSNGVNVYDKRFSHIANKGLLPIIFKRAQLTTPRYGRTAIRNKK